MWRILRQAIGLVLRNFPAALRISVGPLVLLAILLQAVGRLMTGDLFGGPAVLLLGLMAGFILSWVAVAWHRYVLAEEAPSGLLPPMAGPEILQHLGWSFVLSLGALVLSWVLGPVLEALFAPLDGMPGLLAPMAGLLLATSYLGLRFGLVLPAAALGRPMGLQDSWQATRPLAGAILGLALLGLAAFALTGVLVPLLFLAAPGAGVWLHLALTTALNWVSTMLGLSLLTTLYGHLVERRFLAA